MGLSQKVNFKQRPPLTPPYTGGELITKRFLPLCKGELVGVVVEKMTFRTAPLTKYIFLYQASFLAYSDNSHPKVSIR